MRRVNLEASPCCGAPVMAAWVDGILLGVCDKCDRILVRTNPDTLASELVEDEDPISWKPREVVELEELR